MATNIAIFTQPMRPAVSLKRILLPAEHGAWGMIAEPIVAGLAIAFSPAGPWIALFAAAVFMARQPLKVLFSGIAARAKWAEYHNKALQYAAVFAMIAAGAFVGIALTADSSALVPFALAAPLAAYQFYFDITRRGRRLLPEVAGAAAISAVIASMALAAGLGTGIAAALWATYVFRAVPSIMYVRTRLRLEKGRPASVVEPIAASFTALGAVGLLTAAGAASYLTLGVFVLLMLRAAIGLSPMRKKVRATRIGIMEVVYGILVTAAIITGYYLQV